MKIIEVDKVMPLINSIDNSIQVCKTWIQANQREESVIVTPPVVPPVVPPVIPPIGVLGAKTNPIKLDKPYSRVRNGFTHSQNDRKEFGLAPDKRIYFEVDPTFLKPTSTSFQMTIKGMNGPLVIYRAYYDKITQTYKSVDDVYFTAKGCLDYVASNVSRPFSSTKFVYGLEVSESWEIELWVQMY